MDSKFKVGDKVTIIKYGSRYWSYERIDTAFKILYDNVPEGYKVYDINPELVGQTGIVDKVIDQQGSWKYALTGPHKYAWYDEQQLEKT
jgi:hypothetical protein